MKLEEIRELIVNTNHCCNTSDARDTKVSLEKIEDMLRKEVTKSVKIRKKLEELEKIALYKREYLTVLHQACFSRDEVWQEEVEAHIDLGEKNDAEPD
jgi:hypothetical protein